MNTAIRIRLGEADDKTALQMIIRLSFGRFFRFFAEHSIDSEEGKVLVAEQNDVVVGFAKLIDFSVGGKRYGCILWLAVHPSFRRQGIAANLAKAGSECLMQDGAEEVFASVQRGNKPSRATFRKNGFIQVGFIGLWRCFSWRLFQLYSDIWYAPGEIVFARHS